MTRKNTNPSRSLNINVRVSQSLKAELNRRAKLDHRNLSQYILIVLENHVIEGPEIVHRVTSRKETNDAVERATGVRPERPVLEGTSEPPRRIQQQAKARVQSAIPEEVAKQILDDETGWEGSDPAQLFKGTKVKI
jgi:hypothetical protein